MLISRFISIIINENAKEMVINIAIKWTLMDTISYDLTTQRLDIPELLHIRHVTR